MASDERLDDILAEDPQPNRPIPRYGTTDAHTDER